MSTQPIGAPGTPEPAGEVAVAERVRQIEVMIEEARTGRSDASSASTGASSSTSFASALASASQPTADAAGVDYAGESAAGGEYEGLIDQAAQRYGLEPAVLHGLIEQESDFNPDAESSAGAEGLTQLMPGTASSMGVSDPLDPAESIEGGARYLSQLMSEFGGNTTDALAAYNAGPAAVSEAGGVPAYAETESYVGKVLANAEAFRREHPSTLSEEAVL